MDKFIDYYKKQHYKLVVVVLLLMSYIHYALFDTIRSHLEYHYLHTGQMMLALTTEQRRSMQNGIWIGAQ